MAQTLNSLQVYSPKSWSGLTTDNHMSTIFAQQPQLVTNVISEVFGRNQYKGLDYLLSNIGTKELDTDNDYEWMLKGDDRKSINIVSFTASNTTYPGINKSPFTIELDEKYFQLSDVLIFDNREYQARIMAEPESNGVNWLYTVQLMTGDSTLFVPPALLAQGKRVSKIFSAQERTLSRTFGSTSFTSPFKMRNIFSTLAKEHIVPGNMHGRPLLFNLKDPSTGKQTNIWTKYAEWAMLCQWVREKENQLIYSKFNQNSNGTFDMKGASGYPIMQGAGLREQISNTYKFYYSTFTMDYLLEILLNLSVNILAEDKRQFVLLTGERGMVQFHKAMENKVQLFTPMGNPSRLFGSGQNLGFGGQYTSFKGPQGIEVSVVSIPQYNDIIDNRIPHPDGGYTENYRYTILNFGTTEGEANITKVYPKGRKDMMWHIAGSTSPYGPNVSFNTSAASKVDGYEIMALTSQGLMIKNPMSCAELIYSAS